MRRERERAREKEGERERASDDETISLSVCLYPCGLVAYICDSQSFELCVLLGLALGAHEHKAVHDLGRVPHLTPTSPHQQHHNAQQHNDDNSNNAKTTTANNTIRQL
jgi:hypothetical protein